MVDDARNRGSVALRECFFARALKWGIRILLGLGIALVLFEIYAAGSPRVLLGTHVAFVLLACSQAAVLLFTELRGLVLMEDKKWKTE